MYGVIYKIMNQLDGKGYVGQTTRSLEERFRGHIRADSYLGRAIRKYGAENFTCEVIEECDTREQLNEREIFWIAELNTKVPNGYNMTDGGEGTVGCYPSDETRAKLSVATSGENNPFFGKHHTEESLAKMSEAHRGNTAWVGRHHRKESKVKMSAYRRANTPFKNLLAEMDKRQITYKDLAELLGMARMTLPEKMRGVKGFTAVEVIKLEKIFGLPAEYLMARDDGQIFSPSKDSPFKNLLMELDKHKITYRELAKLLGFKNESTVSQKMNGKYNFTKEQVAKLEEIFGLPAEYLLKRD